MCLGIPLQVVTLNAVSANCAPRAHPDQLREIHLGLLDQTPSPGDWLLVHVDLAIRPLSAEEAGQIEDTLQAVLAAAGGLPFEHLLGDLADREPQLPEHLRIQTPVAEETRHG